ncbi:thioredoxin family protein [Methylocystis sp.]|uniref:thioredoxin family protein n=1 Tax=Methylocystis sp. TaxID=1911079 RepID=UPI003DA4D294
MKVKIEVIAAPGCKNCATKQSELRDVAASLFGEANLIWREVNVLEELDYAVALGVLSMPAIAVNGELRFLSLPTRDQFRAALTALGLR